MEDKENKKRQDDLSKGKEASVGRALNMRDILKVSGAVSANTLIAILTVACGVKTPDSSPAASITPDTSATKPTVTQIAEIPTVTQKPTDTETATPTEIQGEYGDFNSWPERTKETIIQFNEDPTKISMEQLVVLQSDVEALRAKDHREGLISIEDAGMFFGIDKRLASLWRYVDFANRGGKEQVASKQELMYVTPLEIIWMTTNKDMIIPNWWINDMGHLTSYGIFGLPEKFLPDGSVNPEYDKQLKERMSHQIGPHEIDHYLGQNVTLPRTDYQEADGDLALMATLDPRDKDSAILLLHMRDEEGKKQELFPLFVNFKPLAIPIGTPFEAYYGPGWLEMPMETTIPPSQNARREKFTLEDYFSFMGRYVYFLNVMAETPGMAKFYKDLYGSGYFGEMAYGIVHPKYHIEIAGQANPHKVEQTQMWPWEMTQSTFTPTP
jgi:hypothetical protein